MSGARESHWRRIAERGIPQRELKKKGKQMEEWTVKERYKLNEGTLAEIRLICFTTVLSYLQSAKQGLQGDCLDAFNHL